MGVPRRQRGAGDGSSGRAAARTPLVVPGYCDPGEWSAAFGLSYRDLLLADQAQFGLMIRPDGAELRVRAASGGIADARNQIIQQFLDGTQGDWLWMVDTDMGFAPDTVARLLLAADPVERPVIGGLCFALQRDVAPVNQLHSERFTTVPTLYAWREYDGPAGYEKGFAPILDYPEDQLVPVDATGAACLLMHRGPLEIIRERYGDEWCTPVVHPDAGPGGTPRRFSEDLSLCFRLMAIGVQLHVHTGVHTTHDKGGIFLDEDEYRRRRESVLLNR